MRKLTQEEFLVKAKAVHGETYDYSRAVYTTTRSKLIVTCPQHGQFTLLPRDHLSGDGCRACGISRRSERQVASKGASFVARARSVHGDTYDYSKSTYKGSATPITITCRIHGDFEQSPSAHLLGNGCRACWEARRGQSLRHSFDKFVSLARAVHGDRFEYDSDSFSKMHAQVRVKCLEHGWYTQLASDHVYKGSGCNTCADVASANLQVMPFTEFARQAGIRHNHKYMYRDTGYIGYGNKATIVCPQHGEFQQTGGNHVSNGHGCPKCGNTGGPSVAQKDIAELIRTWGFNVQIDYRIPGTLLEVDCYVPEKRVGVEFDGAWWHSERTRPNNYHAEKLNAARAAGIDLIQIFDDQWTHRRETWEALLAHRLGQSGPSVHARACQVVPLDYPTCSTFFDKHHVQGRSSRGSGFGLSVGGQVVAAMSFSTSLSRRGTVACPSVWELVRYATSSRVPGGASRLFSAFVVAHPECAEVVSYSDNRAFSGKMYPRLGFTLDEHIPPDYSYTAGGATRINKRKLQLTELPNLLGGRFDPAMTEHENAIRNGFYRVYDSGKIRWKWFRK